MFPGQLGGVDANGGVILGNGQKLPHPGEELIADLREPFGGVGEVDVAEFVERVRPQRLRTVGLEPDDCVDERAAAEAERAGPRTVRPEV
jgi:hypothetical protein